jgi:hypothetical protein
MSNANPMAAIAQMSHWIGVRPPRAPVSGVCIEAGCAPLRVRFNG